MKAAKDYWARAEHFERRAEQCAYRGARNLYLEIAFQWRQLAGHVEPRDGKLKDLYADGG